jgi:hypothetical protein
MRDTGSDHRISVGVDDRTGNPLVLSHHDDTAQRKQRHHQEVFETHTVDGLVVIKRFRMKVRMQDFVSITKIGMFFNFCKNAPDIP